MINSFIAFRLFVLIAGRFGEVQVLVGVGVGGGGSRRFRGFLGEFGGGLGVSCECCIATIVVLIFIWSSIEVCKLCWGRGSSRS